MNIVVVVGVGGVLSVVSHPELSNVELEMLEDFQNNNTFPELAVGVYGTELTLKQSSFPNPGDNYSFYDHSDFIRFEDAYRLWVEES